MILSVYKLIPSTFWRFDIHSYLCSAFVYCLKKEDVSETFYSIKKASDYDQEMPQLNNADQPKVP